MGLLLLFNGPGGTDAAPVPSADLGALTAAATVTFTPARWRADLRCARRVGRAKPTHYSRKASGYRVAIQGETPFYMAAIPITGSTPPAAETVWIEDLSGVIVGAVGNGGGLAGDITEMCHEERLGEYEALWLTVPASSVKADLLDVDVVLKWRDRRFRIAAREEKRDGQQATIELEAAALWLDLADRRPAGDQILTSSSPAFGLSRLLADTNWTVGTVPADSTTHTVSDTDASVLELIRTWAKVCGYEVAFDTKRQRVSFVTSIGQDRGVGFRYGHNLRDIERRIEPPKSTRLWAYGRDNIDITAVEPSGLPYVTDYSYYTGQGVSSGDAVTLFTRDEVWVDDSYVDDNDLYTAALARLAIRAQPTLSYVCKVIDLVRVGGDGFWTHSIGDTIGVRDATFSIDVTTRVVRLKRYPFHPYDNEIELASLEPATTETSQSKSVPSSSDWYLYRDTNDAQVVLSGTSEVEVILLPRLQFLDLRGEYLGDAKITATLSGSGVVRLRAVNIQASPFTEIESASWSFNSATFGTWTYELPFSAKGESGRHRVMVVGSITSGSGTATVATDDGLAHILVRGLLSGDVTPPTNSVTFNTPGQTDYWTVPDDTFFVTISAYGGKGTSFGAGYGGYIKVRAAVTPGEVLQIICASGASGSVAGTVGGGTGAGAGNNGGGGGGASDVRRNAYGLDDRFVVAGGGGGGPYNNQAGGGYGGWPSGTAGSGGGGGGTQTAGGAGQGTGSTGAQGLGGDGGTGGVSGGGGGGGGWYGGGGGGGGTPSGTAGGGGSSYYDPAQDVELIEHTTGGNPNTHGSVTIEW